MATQEQHSTSLLSKAKETLNSLKESALNYLKPTYKYSDPNKREIKGMGKIDFEATKVILQSKLKLRNMKGFCEDKSFKSSSSEFDQQQQQFSSGASTSSGFEKKQEFGQVQSDYKQVNQEEWSKAPDAIFEQREFRDDKKDEILLSKKDQNEVHVLPTIKLQEQPKIIEREIEYEKPVEIKQTIVHQEKPIIVEQPIIKEKFEHYRENTQYNTNEQKIEKEINKKLGNNAEQEALLNLRKDYIDSYSNNAPIVDYKKEKVQLPTVVNEQPTIVNEKEVVYQQPVEIEQKYVEKVKPIVNEHVTLEKQHVHEKLAPEQYVNETKLINQGHEFYSKDANVDSNNFNGGVNDERINREEKFVAGGTSQKQQRSV